MYILACEVYFKTYVTRVEETVCCPGILINTVFFQKYILTTVLPPAFSRVPLSLWAILRIMIHFKRMTLLLSDLTLVDHLGVKVTESQSLWKLCSVCWGSARHSATLWLPSVLHFSIIHSGLLLANAPAIRKDFLSGILITISAVFVVLTAHWCLSNLMPHACQPVWVLFSCCVCIHFICSLCVALMWFLFYLLIHLFIYEQFLKASNSDCPTLAFLSSLIVTEGFQESHRLQ